MTGGAPTRPRARVVAALGVLAVAAAGLQWAGRGPLALPGPEGPSWEAWLVERGPVVAAFALVRVGALLVAWYLLASALVGAGLRAIVAARPWGWARAGLGLADLLTLPPVRRLLVGAAGVGLAAGPVAAGRAVALPPAVAVALWQLPPAGPPPTSPEPSGTGPPPTLLLRPLPPAGAGDATTTTTPTTTTTTTTPGAGSPAGIPAPDPAAGPSSTASRVVVPGDSLWSIACDTLAGRLGRAPTDAEVDGYWRALVAANRHRLADPATPDLIYPGQRFELPAS